MPELKRETFDKGPQFTGSQVAELFGVDKSKAIEWIKAGLLVATSNGQDGRAARFEVAPIDVLRFVRERPDAYDWQRITDELLKAEAERIQKTDPVVPLGDVATRAHLPLAEVEDFARRGVFATVARWRGGKGGRPVLWIRRSKVAAAVEAIAAEQRRSSPLAVLHDLLTAPIAAPAPTPAPRQNGAFPYVGVAREAVQAARLGTPLERPSCPKCGARMIHAQDEERGELWSCLACGERLPILDAAKAAALAADAAAVQAERRGPGRPPKMREEAAG